MIPGAPGDALGPLFACILGGLAHPGLHFRASGDDFSDSGTTVSDSWDDFSDPRITF